MKSTISKIVKTISICLLGGILMLGGSLIGMQIERVRLEEQQQEELVTDIAVVNLDEGIYEDGEKKYYSTELLDLESDYLIAENLEGARQGILEEKYGAYIIIPADFSQKATSINGIPEKAVLEFAMNPNLREDVSRLTMANVKNFEITLNTNMSYMYVQALLSEFHNVQDMSGMILQNDNTELERILAVEADSLLVQPEYKEVEWIEPEVEEMDFSGTFDKNQQVIESMNQNYDEFVDNMDEVTKETLEKQEALTEEMLAYCEVLNAVDIEKDDNDVAVCEEGLNALDTYVADYQIEFDTRQARANQILLFMMGKEESVSENDIIADVRGQIVPVQELAEQKANAVATTANQKFTAYNGDIKTQVATLKALVNTQLEASRGTDADAQALLTHIQKIEEKLAVYDSQSFMTATDVGNVDLTGYDILLDEVEKIPKVSSDGCQEIITEKVVTPLKQEIEAEVAKVQGTETTVTEAFTEYASELSNTDWSTLYNHEDMTNLLQEFGDNIFTLEEQILETHGAYEEFVYDSVDYANESMTTNQEELETAYDSTVENIFEEVALAKDNRESMNAANTEILGSFQEKLPYTRIGQLEYVQAYDFMVNPIKLSDASVEKDRTVLWQDYEALRNIMLIMLAALFGCISLLMYLRLTEYREEEFEVV